MMIKILMLIICLLLNYGVVSARDLPVDVGAEIVPANMSESEMDVWISQNKDNFDFYVEGRSVAEYRKETQRNILQARKDAQGKIARIDERLKEQLTGKRKRDKELEKAAEKKRAKVYAAEMAREEKLLNRQLRREVAIMRRKKITKSKIANFQKEFRQQIASMKKDNAKRVGAAAANMPEQDEDISKETSGRSKIKIDKNRRIKVERQQYGGEMSDRARRRLRSR